PGRAGRRDGPGQRDAPAGAHRQRRGVLLLERAGTRLPPLGDDRRDGAGDPAGRHRLPLVHAVAVAVGRARKRAVALPGRVRGLRAVPPAHRAGAEEQVRRDPVPGVGLGGAALGPALPGRGAGRGVPPLPPVVGEGRRARPGGARGRHLEPRPGAAEAMSGRRVGGTSAAALAVATAAGNVLAYVFTIAMSRLLGVRDFGELGTLLAVWLIAQIPTLACQLTAARAVAAADPPLTGADLPPGAGQVAAADWATEKGQAPGAGQALGADWVAETDQAPGAGLSIGVDQATGVTPGAGGDRATAQVSPAGVDPAGGAAPGSGGVEAAGMLRLG